MRRIMLSLVVLIGLAGVLTATTKQTTITSAAVKLRHCTVQDFSPFSGKVWDPARWKRKKLPNETRLAQRQWLRCAASKRHQKAMQRRWRRDKRTFKRHQKKKFDDLRFHDAINPPGMAVLRRIASCESGGDPTAVSSDGSYRGKYQFSFSTWESVGGSGDPAAAPEREQDERAAALYQREGSSPWPICG